MEPQQDINILALLALRQMLNFADDCLVSNKHNGWTIEWYFMNTMMYNGMCYIHQGIASATTTDF